MNNLFLPAGIYEDDVWTEANEFVNELPDGIIEKHRGKLTKLFTIHAKTLQGEIKRRAPDETFMVEALDYIIKERIEKGDVREALRDLAIGVLAFLPERGSMELDPRFEGIIGHTTDKTLALHTSIQQNNVGIMPATRNYITKYANQDAADFYREKLGQIFPDARQIKIAGP